MSWLLQKLKVGQSGDNIALDHGNSKKEKFKDATAKHPILRQKLYSFMLMKSTKYQYISRD